MRIDKSLEVQVRGELYRRSYYEFFKWGFSVLFPSEHYEDSKHIKEICNLLEKEVRRLIRREEKDKDFIINIPPRTSKTLLTHTILLPWVWSIDPTVTMIVVSFDDELVLLNAQYSKDIIQDPLYQAMFGDTFKLRKEFDSKGMFMNDRGGFKLSKTTGSNITGHKGCFVKGSKVLLSNNEEKNIEEIQKGEILETYNEKRNLVEIKPVLETSVKKYTGKLYTFKTLSGKILRCTEEHPIYTKNRGWVLANELDCRDILLLDFTQDDDILIDTIIEEVENIDVYNLELQDNNNFFVDRILVHNSIIVVDDPISPKNAESVPFRKSSIEYYTRSLYNRLTPVQYGFRVIVMQRIHEEDLSGYLLKKNPEDYHHICLPAEIGLNKNAVKPIELQRIYSEDGLLDPIRLGKKYLNSFLKVLGSRGYAGQYDQNPSPDAGGILKIDWYDIVRPESIIRDQKLEPIHFFIDSAYTEKTENDPTAIMACFRQGNYIYVLDVIEVWMEFPQLLRFIPQYVARFQYSHDSKIFVEPKASGKSIVQQLRDITMLNVIESPAPTDSKITRTHGVAPIHESRRFKLIDGAYITHYLDQLRLFPNATHDDMVDITVNATNELLVNGNSPDFMFV